MQSPKKITTRKNEYTQAARTMIDQSNQKKDE